MLKGKNSIITGTLKVNGYFYLGFSIPTYMTSEFHMLRRERSQPRKQSVPKCTDSGI
jgi:hypothetical protein